MNTLIVWNKIVQSPIKSHKVMKIFEFTQRLKILKDYLTIIKKWTLENTKERRLIKHGQIFYKE